ncbi:expressed unknown protein [Seminavis robusta]|uniref:CSC1/OSCA1-like 7TM region domain-containing protein n=1 Tax=Seminavis robusta TaxID=568900 RepID=A0A9N8DX46_9STRA|nr:expressed unknown protein [Seminavis robusta]|eukprot:Sro442_g143920.1 n/a (399) ;mRNA; f:43470-45175
MQGRLAVWMAFLFGVTRSPWEYLITVDLSNTWRRHLVWSKKNGDELKNVVTQRFASSTVFLSLLFSSELSILYTPSDPGNDIRVALLARDYRSAEYWTGVVICFAIFFSVTALVANFTATSIFSSLSKENAPIVLRSTLGLYAAQLPSRLVTGAIYLFFLVVICTWVILMPQGLSLGLGVVASILLIHIVNTFSSMGRVIMDSGAMSQIPILDPEEEEKLDPHELSAVLIKRVVLARKAQVPINHQYKVDYQDTLRDVQEGNVTFPLTESELHDRASRFHFQRSTMGKAAKNFQYTVSESLQSAGSAARNSAASIPGPDLASNVANKTKTAVGNRPGGKNLTNISEEVDDNEEEDVDQSQEIVRDPPIVQEEGMVDEDSGELEDIEILQGSSERDDGF